MIPKPDSKPYPCWAQSEGGGIKEPVKFDSQAQVSDAAGAVSLHEDILTLQVSVSDGWFAMCPIDLGVKVAQAARCRKCQFQQGLRVQGGKLQVVV